MEMLVNVLDAEAERHRGQESVAVAEEFTQIDRTSYSPAVTPSPIAADFHSTFRSSQRALLKTAQGIEAIVRR